MERVLLCISAKSGSDVSQVPQPLLLSRQLGNLTSPTCTWEDKALAADFLVISNTNKSMSRVFVLFMQCMQYTYISLLTHANEVNKQVVNMTSCVVFVCIKL